ncbi:MAG: hypothetical protein D6674_02545 [Acidobacteria bacterium]|jgi:hypothetical protein|nr:MAG: hypothetical protein D6674_02545 [Acidobacteriota bacterium]
MKVIEVKNGKVAKRLTNRLLRKGMVVAQADKREDVNKRVVSRVDVLIVLSESDGVSETLD